MYRIDFEKMADIHSGPDGHNMTNKLKILCLHGYWQNATRFNSHLGAIRKMLKNEADFYFLSAPNVIPGYGKEGDEGDYRAWWFTRGSSFSSKDETNSDTGFDNSLREIEKCFKEKGPFHGILGFSQGAALVGILCGLRNRKEINIDFNFVIIVSGFKSLCSKHKKYYEQKFDLNSLHVIGETDHIIPKELSYDLASVFINPVILLHPGGHLVPSRSIFKENYLSFVTAQKIT